MASSKGEWTKQQNNTEKLRMSFIFLHFLSVSKMKKKDVLEKQEFLLLTEGIVKILDCLQSNLTEIKGSKKKSHKQVMVCLRV